MQNIWVKGRGAESGTVRRKSELSSGVDTGNGCWAKAAICGEEERIKIWIGGRWRYGKDRVFRCWRQISFLERETIALTVYVEQDRNVIQHIIIPSITRCTFASVRKGYRHGIWAIIGSKL